MLTRPLPRVQVQCQAEVSSLEEQWKAALLRSAEVATACRAVEAQVAGLRERVPQQCAALPPVNSPTCAGLVSCEGTRLEVWDTDDNFRGGREGR